VTAFFIMLVMPLLGNMLGVNSATVTSEKRQLAELPNWHFGWKAVSDFPAQFEAFYNDHFGFRGTLIAWRNRMEVSLFKESPTPLVVIGKEGWLFYAGDSANQESIKDYEGLLPLSSDTLQSMRTSLDERKLWLAKQGIGYLFVVVPNKHTIYPEYLRSTRTVHVETRLDQFVTYMNQHSFRDYIDLRETMTGAKTLGILYYKIDSHWNMLGAWVAQHKILERLSENFPVSSVKPLSEFKISHFNKTAGDLTNMLGVSAAFLDDDILLQAREPRRAPSRTPYVSGALKGFATEVKDDRLPRVLVFGDSFMDVYLADFLAEHFRKAIFLRSPFDPTLVQREKPDLVITETAERYLTPSAAPNPPQVQ
jgi:alginate O-acetyltransferase complex protein AlgJ